MVVSFLFLFLFLFIVKGIIEISTHLMWGAKLVRKFQIGHMENFPSNFT
jgi:hypothetical protein